MVVIYFLVRYKNCIMQVISKGDSSRRLSKPRSDLELPKISKSPCPQGACYQMRYEWVTRSSEYLLLSNHQVQQQHTYLLAELTSLQDEHLRITDNTNSTTNPTNSTKPLRRSHQANIAQNRQRDIESNNAMIWKLRNEVELLQKQAGTVSKEGIQGAIGDVKEKITKTKQKIKEIKQKSRQMCDSFQNGQDHFEEMQRLEHERDGLQFKRLKAEQKYTASISNYERLQTKLSEIQGQVLYAQSFLQNFYSNQKSDAVQKDMENQQRQKTYQTQILRKTIESIRNTKQQRCHQLLKSLQTQVQKLQLLEKKYNNIQIKGLYQKKELIQLQQHLTELQIAAKERLPTSGSLEARPALYEQSDSIKQPFKLAQIKQVRYRHHLDHQPTKTVPHSSRTKTSGYYYEPKSNQTEIHRKPPTSETENGDMTRMVSQALPVNRGYFRTSRSKLAANTEKIDLHSKTAVVGVRNQGQSRKGIKEEIQQQSPDKQTIDKNTLEVKFRQQENIKYNIEQKVQQSPELYKDQVQQKIQQPQSKNQIQGQQKVEIAQQVEQGESKVTIEQVQQIKHRENKLEQQQQAEVQEEDQLITEQPIKQHVKVQQSVPQQLNKPQAKMDPILQKSQTSNLPQQIPQQTPQQLALIEKRNIIHQYVNQFDQQDPEQQSFK